MTSTRAEEGADMDSRFTRFVQPLLRVGRLRQEGRRNEIDRSIEGASQEGWRDLLAKVFCHNRRNLTETPSNGRTPEDKKVAVQQCPICLDDMMSYREEQVDNTSIVVETVKCSHKFHLNCIKVWFRYSHTCPLCRSAVDAEGGIDITELLSSLHM